MSDVEKLAAAIVSMEGEAFAWLQWEDTHRLFRSWESFKGLFLKRFGPRDEEEMFESFFLWQEGTICEYHRDFEQVTSTVDDIPKRLLEG